MTIPNGSGAAALGAGALLPHEADRLLAALCPLLLALTIGVLAATLLRGRGLHWSWAACALACALALAPLLGDAAPVAIVACAAGAIRARRRHRSELEAGGDLGRQARACLTPLATARMLGVRLAEARPAAEPGERPGTLLLGHDPAGRAIRIPFAPGRAGHMLVLGATGSGKTVTQTLIAERAVQDGRAVIVVDPKGDAMMRARLEAAASRAGRRFIEWTPAGPCSYNPYARGGETEIADRLLAGERFTEPHYLRQAQRYLGHAIRGLRACRQEVSLGAIVELLEPRALEVLLRDAEVQQTGGYQYLDSLTPRQLRDLAGIRDRLAILAESEVGRWLGADRADCFDLLQACRSRSVVWLGLEADSRPLAAQMIGAAVISDLQSAVAALQRAPAPTLAVIDEFSALGARHVTALFGRARSAGVSLLLGTQELADLRPAGADRLLEQVLGNIAVLLAHRQVVPSSADLLCRLAGTRGCWRVSWSTGGRTTRTRTAEPVLDADTLMALSPGRAVLIGFGEARGVSLVAVRRPGGER